MNDPTIDNGHLSRECPECGQRFSRDGVFCPFDGTRLETTRVSGSIDPLLGATIDGRYEVIELLGEGGMGRVYSVLHTSLGRLFALKALRRELARDEELSQRFMREAKAMASVRHPHIVEITDFGRLPDGVPYFVMELLVGETLAQVIKNEGCVPVARGVGILEQMASALAAAHEAGVVHRDLKPENVFLVGSGSGRSGKSETDDVRVVDFGAAKIIGSSQVTRNGVVFGTPYYMSPEQASGSPVDTRTDIYSFGVIMYEMFTGKVPFEGDTYMNVLTQHMFVEPEPPSRRSPLGASLGALDQVSLICLAKRPEKRFASMPELLDALKAAAAGDAPPRASMAPESAARWGVPEDGQPSLEDIRRAVEHTGLPSPVAWGWIALAAIGIGAALGAMFWVYSHRLSAQAEMGAGATSAHAAESAPTSKGLAGEGPRQTTGPASILSAFPAAPAEPSASVAPSVTLVPGPQASGSRSKVRPPPSLSPAAAAPPPAPIDDVADPFARMPEGTGHDETIRR